MKNYRTDILEQATPQYLLQTSEQFAQGKISEKKPQLVA